MDFKDEPRVQSSCEALLQAIGRKKCENKGKWKGRPISALLQMFINGPHLCGWQAHLGGITDVFFDGQFDVEMT